MRTKRSYTVKGINGVAVKNLAVFELKEDSSETVYSPFRIEKQDGVWMVVYERFTERLSNCKIFVLKANGWQRVRVNTR